MKKCTYCGEEIQDKAKKCRYCGEWFGKDKKEIEKIEDFTERENINKENVIDLNNEVKHRNEKEIVTKTRLIWGIILSLSLIIIFIISVVINWVGSIMELTGLIDIISYITGLLYFISIIFLTPFGIYLLVSNKDNKKSENINDIEYIGFGERLGAHFIDGFLAYLIIPLFFNLYYWFKNGQTIGYKIIGIKTFSVDGNKIKSASGLQLFLYPFLKILNIFTLYIGFIMIGFTKKKQGLHNIISNTVVVRVEKKNNKWVGIIVGIFATIMVLGILSTIAFISLQGYSEDARKAAEIENQDNIIFNINNWMYIDDSSKLINEEFDKETLKEINEEAEKGFLTNKGNYVLVIPEIIDLETSQLFADEKNNNQNKLNLKSYILGLGGKNITSEIKKINGINFYIFSYKIDIDGNVFYYYAIFGGRDLGFENIYFWGEDKENIREEGEFFINHIKVNNYEN